MQKRMLMIRGILIAGILISIVSVICASINNRKSNQEFEKGYLIVEDNGDGRYGTLFYKQLTGKTVLITDKVLENGDYCGLDDKREIIYYIGEDHTLFVCKKGQKPIEVRKNIEDRGNQYRTELVDDNGRYWVYTVKQEGDQTALYFYDKEEMKEYAIGIAGDNVKDIQVDEKNDVIYFGTEEGWFSSQHFGKPKLIMKGASLFDPVNEKESKEEIEVISMNDSMDHYFYKGEMKGELIKDFSMRDCQVCHIDKETIALCEGFDSSLHVKEKGSALALVLSDVSEIKYEPKEEAVYYIDIDHRLKRVNIKGLLGKEEKKVELLISNVAKYNVIEDGKWIVYTSYEGDTSTGKLCLWAQDGSHCIVEKAKYCQFYENHIVYKDEKDMKHLIKVDSHIEGSAAQCIVMQDIDGQYTIGKDGRWAAYIAFNNGQNTLNYYSDLHEEQVLLPDADQYAMIKFDNLVYYSPMKKEQLAGYYYSEKYDVIMSFTKEGELILYNTGEEKRRADYKIEDNEEGRKKINEAAQKSFFLLKGKLCLSTTNGEPFNVEITNGLVWHKLDFLRKDTLLLCDDGGKWQLQMGEEEIDLVKLTEEQFKAKLKEQKQSEEEKNRCACVLTADEARLIVKWYNTCIEGYVPNAISQMQETEEAFVFTSQSNKAHGIASYKVEKLSGKITPLQDTQIEQQQKEISSITYEIVDDMLWMKDGKGNKARLLNLKKLYFKNHLIEKQSIILVGNDADSIYIEVFRDDEEDDYSEAAICRYDLLTRKMTLLDDVESALDYGVTCKLEDRGTLCITYGIERHYLDKKRIDNHSGKIIAYLCGGCIEEENMIYEIVCPADKKAYYIGKYDKKTGEESLLCKINRDDYYMGILMNSLFKVGDEVYFNDYSYYLTEEEKQDNDNSGSPFEAFCKVNVVSGKVERISEEEYLKQQKIAIPE